jgi:hypothetical protein
MSGLNRLGGFLFMTKEQIKSAVDSGKPFTISMADGKSYHVEHGDYLFIHPTAMFVVVFELNGYSHSLPMRTMTALGQLANPEHQP